MMAVICGLAGAGLALVYGAGQVLDAPGWARSAVKTGSVLLWPAAAGMARFVRGTYWSAQALFTLAFCVQSLR